MKKVIAIVGAGLLLASSQASFAVNSFHVRIHNEKSHAVYLTMTPHNLNGPHYGSLPLAAGKSLDVTYNPNVSAINKLEMSVSDDAHGYVSAFRSVENGQVKSGIVTESGDLKDSNLTSAAGEFGNADLEVK